LELRLAKYADTCNSGETDPSPENPLSYNLSCDAHKNHPVNKDRLTNDAETTLINPLELSAFTDVFSFDKSSGRLKLDLVACRQVGVHINFSGLSMS
jgi:hypothetical protein